MRKILNGFVVSLIILAIFGAYGNIQKRKNINKPAVLAIEIQSS